MPKIFNAVSKLPTAHYTEMLEERVPFVFTRWGDGEWEAMLQTKRNGAPDRNCDGHFYYPDMVAELRDILLNAPRDPFAPVYFGLLKIARRMYEPAISDILPGFQWVDGDVLLEDFVNGQLTTFFQALRARRLLYVGPERMKGLTAHLPIARWVTCPLKNAWLEIDALVSEVATYAAQDVIGLSCGPAAKVLAHRLHQLRPDVTIIDFGSMFDGVCGFTTRSYHKGRDWWLISRQME